MAKLWKVFYVLKINIHFCRRRNNSLNDSLGIDKKKAISPKFVGSQFYSIVTGRLNGYQPHAARDLLDQHFTRLDDQSENPAPCRICFLGYQKIGYPFSGKALSYRKSPFEALLAPHRCCCLIASCCMRYCYRVTPWIPWIASRGADSLCLLGSIIGLPIYLPELLGRAW